MKEINFTTKTEIKPIKEELVKIKDGEISEYLLKLDYGENTYPSKYTISWELDQIDTIGFWSPENHFDPNITPDWYKRVAHSRITRGAPVASLYNKDNINTLTISLSDPKTSIEILAGVIEETGKIGYEISLFTGKASRMRQYQVIIRLDTRKIPFYEAARSAADWWEELGYLPAYQPKDATAPLYSAWYSFHQHTIPSEIIFECKIAKALGMDTMIVDDGWQTNDNSRGYGYCGDWDVCKEKIPDMKSFVDEIHALDMKFILWFSVPFVGYYSKSYKRFEGMYLSDRKNVNAVVLDPRFKEVRDYLVNTYKRFVLDYGIDGFKLDFIDSFCLSEESSKEYDKMSTASVEDAVEMLLEEISSELKAINPEILIEFRQSYVGPVISRYGNMFRVTDCPNDPLMNRVHSLNMRITGKGAVHSDMMMWHKDEADESVAYQLLNTIFCVPQISVRFDNITDGHKRVLCRYLDFWRAHKETLLDGKMEFFGVEANYTQARSTLNNESIGILYQPVVFRADASLTSYVFNASSQDYIYIELDKDSTYISTDMYGNELEKGKLKAGISKINLPACAQVKIN